MAAFSADRYRRIRGTEKEQFIEELFPVDIRYALRIDCNVTQDGFRPRFLSEILRERKWLSRRKQLDFQIMYTNCPTPYSTYWKVRNVGEEAKARHMIRGEIRCTDSSHKKEHTDFYGPHYVECFLVSGAETSQSTPASREQQHGGHHRPRLHHSRRCREGAERLIKRTIGYATETKNIFLHRHEVLLCFCGMRRKAT